MGTDLPPETEHPFAPYVRTLGRGPGKSRSLTREEARDALGMVLRGEADPLQVGAFLMLLRYRGEDPAEIAGLVEAARDTFTTGAQGRPVVALDWPSYGAGRTRGEPWFLLAALALARAGVPVLMHGSNEFSQGTAVEAGLAELGLPVARSLEDACRQIEQRRFAYLPLAVLSPGLDRLLGLRGLLGLRSPINTVVRLLNPFDAGASVGGVFHPAYIAVHLGAAERLGHGRLAVVKGGGGEAERNPAKAVAVHLFDREAGRDELLLPSLGDPHPAPVPEGEGDLRRAWEDGVGPGAATAQATLALALLALGHAVNAEAADAQALAIWSARREAPVALVA
jgi:anthranilate phosphoribosyltransferase